MNHKGRFRLGSLPDKFADVLIPHSLYYMYRYQFSQIKQRVPQTSLQLLKLCSRNSPIPLPLPSFLSQSWSFCNALYHCCNATWSVYQYLQLLGGGSETTNGWFKWNHWNFTILFKVYNTIATIPRKSTLGQIHNLLYIQHVRINSSNM